MAGFLDSKERVIDMELTGFGRRLLSEGRLNFVYWCAFDDDIDYDVYAVDGLSNDQILELRTRKIEDTPLREVTNGMRLLSLRGDDTTNVINPLFTIPPGQEVLPRMQVEIAGGTVIEMKQQEALETVVRRDDLGNVIESDGPFSRGVNRFDTNQITANLFYVTGSFEAKHALEGFYLQAFASGGQGISPIGDVAVSCSMSHQVGYLEQPNWMDENSSISFGPDVTMTAYSPGDNQ